MIAVETIMGTIKGILNLEVPLLALSAITITTDLINHSVLEKDNPCHGFETRCSEIFKYSIPGLVGVGSCLRT